MSNVFDGDSPTNLAEYSVSELSGSIKRTVETAFDQVRVRGEISGYRGPHSSGHADIGMLLHSVLACLLLLSFSVVHGVGGGRTGRCARQGDHREKLQDGAFENPSHCLAFRAFVDLD